MPNLCIFQPITLRHISSLRCGNKALRGFQHFNTILKLFRHINNRHLKSNANAFSRCLVKMLLVYHHKMAHKNFFLCLCLHFVIRTVQTIPSSKLDVCRVHIVTNIQLSRYKWLIKRRFVKKSLTTLGVIHFWNFTDLSIFYPFYIPLGHILLYVQAPDLFTCNSGSTIMLQTRSLPQSFLYFHISADYIFTMPCGLGASPLRNTCSYSCAQDSR